MKRWRSKKSSVNLFFTMKKPTPFVRISEQNNPLKRTALALLVAACAFAYPLQSFALGETTTVTVSWPTQGAPDSSIHVLRGAAGSLSSSDYYLFWSVEGGTYNKMTSVTGTNYKEAKIDFNGWTWKGNGPYKLAVIAQDRIGKEIGRKSFSVTRTVQNGTEVMTSSENLNGVISVPSPVEPTNPVVVTPTTIPTTTPSAPTAAGSSLYVNTSSQAAQAARSFSGSSTDKKRLEYIASQPTAVWLGGWNKDVKTDVAKIATAAETKGQTPVFVLYNIPNRDCGQYSRGGLGNADAYLEWVRAIKSGLTDKRAILIVEPDALGHFSCLSTTDIEKRTTMMKEAVQILKQNSKSRVYIDAGHAKWMPAGTAAERLAKVGINSADGFALNVSNFIDTETSITYGTEVSKKVGNKPFVIDTSRNGNGAPSNGAWCNPSGRALGKSPTLSTGRTLVDGYLWIKAPGESDGSCNGGPSAGVFWTSYAIQLAANAGR
jgi:endoglucanase